VNYYFHKYVGDNPFGFAALDIKAYYMEPQVVGALTSLAIADLSAHQRVRHMLGERN